MRNGVVIKFVLNQGGTEMEVVIRIEGANEVRGRIGSETAADGVVCRYEGEATRPSEHGQAAASASLSENVENQKSSRGDLQRKLMHYSWIKMKLRTRGRRARRAPGFRKLRTPGRARRGTDAPGGRRTRRVGRRPRVLKTPKVNYRSDEGARPAAGPSGSDPSGAARCTRANYRPSGPRFATDMPLQIS
ncbi:hypothetical protein EVAR_74574_1 [Eumeta japonica]|uniref:Uncharacterized protein n=1 Tax=Eumeta variegata TaxID=151549 RepID=A0A4C1TET2_EUMVA|nr:hypothetical protein EVAR_74574_1 [Eumeta japonica]